MHSVPICKEQHTEVQIGLDLLSSAGCAPQPASSAGWMIIRDDVMLAEGKRARQGILTHLSSKVARDHFGSVPAFGFCPREQATLGVIEVPHRHHS